MLKQLHELRTKCASFEGQLDTAIEQDRLMTESNAEVEHTIVADEERFWDATKRSSEDQDRIRALAVSHPRLETETTLLAMQSAQEQREIADAGEVYRQMRRRYHRVCKDAGAQFRPKSRDTASQMNPIAHGAQACQARIRGTATAVTVIEEESDYESEGIDSQTVTMISVLNDH
jgi:hypothetical protein